MNSQLLTEFMKGDIARHIIINLSLLDFESRKDAVLIIGSMLRRQHGVRWPMAEHLAECPEVFDHLVNCYESSELCSAVGTILRDSIRHERLASMLLESRGFWMFFKLVQDERFDIAGDSFLTLKELLTRHKALVSHFINQNYVCFFEHLNGLLASDNYVAKRQSIRLLGELLINRLNFSAMIRYTSNSENLKLVMNLLSEQSRAIQFEAFHVFKVFIANPEKNQAILAILTRNRVKLLGFLQNFCNERDKDDQFNDEKDYMAENAPEDGEFLVDCGFERPPSPMCDPTKQKPEMLRNGKKFSKIHHIPLVGAAIVEVIHIESPSSFWVRPYNHITSQLILEEPTSEPLIQFAKHEFPNLLKRYCMAPLEDQVSEGDLAADVTQRRYGRARVVEAVSNELVRVIFIDEGRLQWVNPICLAVMPDNFYYHPWQAMYMCLGGVSPIDSSMTEARPRWTEKHDAAFREIIREFELFKVVAIKSTVLHDNYAKAHLVDLFGLKNKQLDQCDKVDVDILGLFGAHCYGSVVQMPVFNAATYVKPAPFQVYEKREVTDQRYETFPDQWEVEQTDEVIEKRNQIAGQNLVNFDYDAEDPKFQIVNMDLKYLQDHKFVSSDGTVLFHVFGAYLQNPYEFYGIPYRKMRAVADDVNNREVEQPLTMREAMLELTSERKEFGDQLDLFYRKKFNRIPMDRPDVNGRKRVMDWLERGIRVYGICSCIGMERRKRNGVYQRVEIICADTSDTYRLRFLDTGGIVAQVYHTEVYQINPRHCQRPAICMQLCWHGVKDNDAAYAAKRAFQVKVIAAFKENFYCDGPIRLTLRGTHEPSKKVVYKGVVPVAPHDMWNVTCCSIVELDSSLTQEMAVQAFAVIASTSAKFAKVLFTTPFTFYLGYTTFWQLHYVLLCMSYTFLLRDPKPKPDPTGVKVSSSSK
ncbi:unnamed protein product, partial [Mesorhabditis belari]|uniref:Tudor domain-containing protein n=1 Tax=Mesorhabditis belari TaxID=2138241 RepID=A0AAF3EV73_9BILA